VTVTAQRFLADGRDYILVTGISTEQMLERFIGTFLTWPLFRDPVCLLLDLTAFEDWSPPAHDAVDRAVAEFGSEGRWLGVLVSSDPGSEVTGDEAAHYFRSRSRAVRAINALPNVIPSITIPEQSARPDWASPHRDTSEKSTDSEDHDSGAR